MACPYGGRPSRKRRRAAPAGRVLVVPGDLESNRTVEAARTKIVAPPNTLLPYAIPAVTGKNQLFPRWYQEFAALIEPQPHLSHLVFDSLQIDGQAVPVRRANHTMRAVPVPRGRHVVSFEFAPASFRAGALISLATAALAAATLLAGIVRGSREEAAP